MPTHTPPAPPRVLPALITALRADLTAARFTSGRIEELLGEVALGALRRENPVPARRILATSTDPAAVLAQLFTLGVALPRPAVEAALPQLSVDGAAQLGLVCLGPISEGTGSTCTSPIPGADGNLLVHPLLDLSPYSATDDAGEITWWIASDLSELATGAALHPEHVLGVGGASLTLARLTPRTPTGRVLDLGCGGGIQALHASRHAEHVTATDLSERALADAAFTAALNGIDLDLRHGSLLEPVAGERFDLIVSNPPFVITPRTADEDASGGWTYRDGGRAGDTLLAELLQDLPGHLAPGGRAVMLGNWEIPDVEDPFAHPTAWLQHALADGVDAWVIQRESEDPAQYAETWARDGGITDRDPRWAELITAWLEDFAARNVTRIGFGYLLLHRPEDSQSPTPSADQPTARSGAHTAPARRGVLRTETVPGTGSGTLATHLAAGQDMIARLATLSDEELLASRLIRAEDVVERRHLTPGQFDPMLIELVQGAGLARTVPADQLLAATVGALDGTLTLGQVIGAVCALTDADADAAQAQLLPQIRELLITGMVTL